MVDRVNRKLIAYGAGDAAKKNIKLYTDVMEISEIWDNYSNQISLYDIPINKPRKASSDEVIVIFIDKEKIRENVIHYLTELEHRHIFYYMDIDRLRWQLSNYCTQDTAGDFERYEWITTNHVPVLFLALDGELREKRAVVTKLEDSSGEELLVRLNEKLHIESLSKAELKKAIKELFETWNTNLYEFSLALEELIYLIVNNGTKTRKRPIRMEGDKPYDIFAVTESLDIVFTMLYGNNTEQAEDAVRILCRAMPSVPMKILLCTYLVRNGNYNEALNIARKMMHERPNDFGINENFYQVAAASKRNGIEVLESLPDYDLKEVFCWSGVDYVWCNGMDESGVRPSLGPCFRATCAAKPEGEFENGEEWKEFRRSLFDGSFRYCQKNQCPNIVGRWLPAIKSCDDPIVKQLREGNEGVTPLIKEIHFSYDTHCNLVCPSCRTERCINSIEETEKLNAIYDAYLKSYVDKAEHLCLSGCGEALISEHGKHILTSFSDSKYDRLAVELRTNITALNQNTWTALGEARKRIRHIAASVDGVGDVFEELRYPAKWDMVRHNLEFISSLRRNGEIDLFEIHVVAQKRNIHQLFDIVMLASDLGADAVTFSKIVNWRGMSEQEYDEKNPFWTDSSDFKRLSDAFDRIDDFRRNTEKGRKMYINMHFRPDLDTGYEKIRMGRLKIR